MLNEKNSILVDCDDIDGWVNSINKLRNVKEEKLLPIKLYQDFNNFTWKNRATNVVDLILFKNQLNKIN